jgi:hypothetical protein
VLGGVGGVGGGVVVCRSCALRLPAERAWGGGWGAFGPAAGKQFEARNSRHEVWLLRVLERGLVTEE